MTFVFLYYPFRNLKDHLRDTFEAFLDLAYSHPDEDEQIETEEVSNHCY